MTSLSSLQLTPRVILRTLAPALVAWKCWIRLKYLNNYAVDYHGILLLNLVCKIRTWNLWPDDGAKWKPPKLGDIWQGWWCILMIRIYNNHFDQFTADTKTYSHQPPLYLVFIVDSGYTQLHGQFTSADILRTISSISSVE